MNKVWKTIEKLRKKGMAVIMDNEAGGWTIHAFVVGGDHKFIASVYNKPAPLAIRDLELEVVEHYASLVEGP